MQAYYGFIVRAKTKFEADIDQFEKKSICRSWLSSRTC